MLIDEGDSNQFTSKNQEDNEVKDLSKLSINDDVDKPQPSKVIPIRHQYQSRIFSPSNLRK